MNQYQVPQFIDIEAKIVGPFTLKQFGYLASPIVFGFILSLFVSDIIAIIATIPLLVLGVALAFLKVAGVPFPKYLLNMVQFSFKGRLYVFKKSEPEINVFGKKQLEKIEMTLAHSEKKPKTGVEHLASLIQTGFKRNP